MTWDVSRFQSLDFETHLIQDGLAAPPLVVGSTAWWDSSQRAVGRLLHPSGDAYEYAKALLASDRIVVGANVAYDMVVLCAEGQRRGDPTAMDAVVCAYSERRVFDILIASALVHQRDFDTHPTLALMFGDRGSVPTGRKVVRQREMSPVGWVRAQD